MYLTEIITKAQGIINDAVVAKQTSDFEEAHNQMEKLHDLMHEPETLAESIEQPAEKPQSEIDTVDQPAEPIGPAEPESSPEIKDHIKTVEEKSDSTDGSGVVSAPDQQESAPGSGEVSAPEESQNKSDSGVVK